jgi:hypothetical protein
VVPPPISTLKRESALAPSRNAHCGVPTKSASFALSLLPYYSNAALPTSTNWGRRGGDTSIDAAVAGSEIISF